MSLDQEKIRAFRRLYIATNQLLTRFEATGNAGPFDEPCIQQAIANVDKMIGLLPFDFPQPALGASTDRILPINPNDVENEPPSNGVQFPEGVIVYYASNVLNDLRYWKLLMLSRVAYLFPEASILDKYKPLIFQQAEFCLDALPDILFGEQWLLDRITFCADQIGWVARDFDDPQKLEAALVKVERGFVHSVFEGRKYIQNKKAYLLLKLGRNEEAFQITFKALQRDADDPGFAELKTDERYLLWLEEKAKKEEADKQELEKAYDSFLLFVAAEQARVIDQFIHPQHPLVVEYAAQLNLIKQRMISVSLHK